MFDQINYLQLATVRIVQQIDASDPFAYVPYALVNLYNRKYRKNPILSKTGIPIFFSFLLSMKDIYDFAFLPDSCVKTAWHTEHGHIRKLVVNWDVSGWHAKCLRNEPSFT